jgi:hypothetical protein
VKSLLVMSRLAEVREGVRCGDGRGRRGQGVGLDLGT